MTTNSGLEIDYMSMNDSADGMVVLMSNALVQGREERGVPAFHRWSWASSWPNCHVLAIADPALKGNPVPDGAWYLDTQHDTIRAVGEVVASVAEDRGLSLENVVYYGSSLGGFGALCAAAVTHSRAVVEVPQIDVQNWFPGAIKKIEEHVLQGSIADLRERHPERVDVFERFRYEGHIPEFSIWTNESDKSFQDQLDLLSKARSDALRGGRRVEVVVSAATQGHQVLAKDVATELVAQMLDRGRDAV